MPLPLFENPGSVVDVFQSFVPGYRLVDGGELLIQANLLFSARSGIVGGTTQQNARHLETFINQVTSGSTVVLPPGVPGRYMMVINDTGNPIQVYGISYNPITRLADSIAPSTSSTPGIMVNQNAGEMDGYFCFEPGIWKQVSGLGTPTGSPGGGITDAPVNGLTYGRMNGGWVQVLPLSGGTLTGPLILSTPASTNPNSAVSLTQIQNLAIDEGTY
jgi:hypothetical protein